MTPSAPIIHVVDDDESFRGALARLLRAVGYEVRTYPSAGAFLLVSSPDAPGCLILDVQMPGPSGLDLQEALPKLQRLLPIIFLTGHADVPMTVRAMKAGAIDFLTKPVKKKILLESVKNAVAVDIEKRANHERISVWASRYQSLTEREREIFAKVIVGKLNKQIAAELGASERTVKAHRAHVMAKMQVASVAELVLIAEHLRVAARTQ